MTKKKRELTPKQEAFVQEYMIDLNATQAAIRAGYSKKTAAEQAARLLVNVKVREAVQEAKKKRADRLEVSAEWVLKRYMALADADFTKIAKWDAGGVEFKASEDLDWEEAYTIDEVSLQESIKEDKGGNEMILSRNLKVKQSNDKIRALDAIAKHIGMDKGEVEQHEHRVILVKDADPESI